MHSWMQMGAATVGNCVDFPQKLKSPCDPAIALLGIHLKTENTN